MPRSEEKVDGIFQKLQHLQKCLAPFSWPGRFSYKSAWHFFPEQPVQNRIDALTPTYSFFLSTDTVGTMATELALDPFAALVERTH